jgi:hypothetical protein
MTQQTQNSEIEMNQEDQIIQNQPLSTEEEKVRMDEIKQLVDAENLDPTTSMNIIINAVQACFESDMFNDLDRYLIAKSLNCFKGYVERGEDLVIKVQES